MKVTCPRMKLFVPGMRRGQSDTPTGGALNQSFEIPGDFGVPARCEPVVGVDAQLIEDGLIPEVACRLSILPAHPDDGPQQRAGGHGGGTLELTAKQPCAC